MMEYIVFFLLGIVVGTGITYIFFPRYKILYKENTNMQNTGENQQTSQSSFGIFKPKKPEHSVIVYIESNEHYTGFVLNIDGTLSTANRSTLIYGMRDIINGHYLINYGDGLDRDAKNFIEALATTHLTRTLKTDKANYNISFEIRKNVASLGINDTLVSTQ